MKDPNRFYVYVDQTDAGVPFYVGKGTLGRVREKRRNKKHSGVSRKHGFNRVVDMERVTAEAASLREIELIALHKLNVYKNPKNELACNFTDGGEGAPGRINIGMPGEKNPNFGKTLSRETRAKLSSSVRETMKDPEIRRINSEAHKGEKNPNYGRPHPESTIAKMRALKMGYRNPASKERRAVKALLIFLSAYNE